MGPQNRDGESVEIVPFLVVAASAFLVTYSFGPVYVLELGLGPSAAFVFPTGVFVAFTAVAFHRFVWTADPVAIAEVPASTRFVRMLYGVGATALVLVALTLPIAVGTV